MGFEGTSGLAEFLGGEILGPARPGRPTGYSIDTRTLAAGDLFFALPGTQVDGHRFLAQAAQKGAWGAVVSDRAAALEAGLPAVCVDSPAEALYHVALQRRLELGFPIVAITGTNGKTSTKDLVTQALGRTRKVTGTRGNYNNLLGLPLSLLAADADADLGVFELGMSYPGEIDRLGALARPRFGIITNVSLAHIDGLGSLEAVRDAKGELIAHIHQDGVLYLNADDPSSRLFKARAAHRGLTVRGVTTRGVLGASVHFEIRETSLQGVTGEIVLDIPGGGQKRRELTWPIAGRHMVYPLLFAVLLARDLGDPDPLALCEPEVLAGLAATTGRMRILQGPGGAGIIDDCYNANPASMAAALDFLEEVEVPGKKYAVLGDMFELGDMAPSCHRAIFDRVGRAEWLERTWLIGETFAKVMEDSGEFSPRLQVTQTKATPVEALRAQLGPGDLVLVKASNGVGLAEVVRTLVGEEGGS